MSDGEGSTSTLPAVNEPTAYNKFVSSLSLISVDLVKISGERRIAGASSQTAFELEAGYQLDNQTIRYRFDVKGHLTDEDNTDYGDVTAAVLVTLATDQAPADPFVERFGGLSALMIAHPYLREAIAATAQRLGFLNVVLPLATVQPGSEAATVQATTTN
jgi:hypothetical protein